MTRRQRPKAKPVRILASCYAFLSPTVVKQRNQEDSLLCARIGHSCRTGGQEALHGRFSLMRWCGAGTTDKPVVVCRRRSMSFATVRYCFRVPKEAQSINPRVARTRLAEIGRTCDITPHLHLASKVGFETAFTTSSECVLLARVVLPFAPLHSRAQSPYSTANDVDTAITTTWPKGLVPPPPNSDYPAVVAKCSST